MSQPFIGEIRLVGFNFAPVGWSLCNGATLPISQNSALFNLIGTTYGGNGQTTFQLPNLLGRVPIHQGTSRTGASFLLAQVSGTETVTLTASQVPAHSHPFAVNSQPGTTKDPSGNYIAAPPHALGNTYIPPNTVEATGASTSSTGGSQPHNNMQPFLAVNFIFSLFGIFPSQS
jgi:microcystin-dependent protein